MEIFLLGLSAEGPVAEAVTLTAASQARSPIHLNLSRSPEIILSPAVCLTLTVNEVCSAVLLTGSSSRPDWCLGSKAATCQWFSSHIHRSAPAATDRIPLVSLLCPFSTTLLSASRHGPDICFVLLSIFSHYPSPTCSLRRR